MRAASLVLLGLGALAGCAGAPVRPARPVAAATAESADTGGARLAQRARELIGAPYRFGGASPSGFDCSGLVYYLYREFGVAVPRTAAEQRTAATPVPAEALRPGDLVFFRTPDDHVGIYLGDGEFVHAPATGRPVERARLNSPFFILGYAGAGRFAAP